MFNIPTTIRLSKQSYVFLNSIMSFDDEIKQIQGAMGRDCAFHISVSDIVESALYNYIDVIVGELRESKASYYDYMNEHCKQCTEALASDTEENTSESE